MWFYAKYMKPLLEKCMSFNSWGGGGESIWVHGGYPYSLPRSVAYTHTYTHTHNAKDSKGNWWKPFLFRHKELGHPLIIVNHAINLSVAQMNTALEMRQSLLACYVSLTQFILLFTQDHSYVKLCEGVSLSLPLSPCLSLSHSNSPSLSHTRIHIHSLTERPARTRAQANTLTRS